MEDEKEEGGLGMMICNGEDVASTIYNDNRKSKINNFLQKFNSMKIQE